MNNPTYNKLLEILNETCYGEPVQLGWGTTEEILDAIWPEIVELLAKIAEYDHALGHVVEPAEFHDGVTPCPGCQRLAQSALDGVNREMCREMFLEESDYP